MSRASQRRAVSPEVARALLDLPSNEDQMARNQYAIAPRAFHHDNVALVDCVLGKTIWNAAANMQSRHMAGNFNIVPRLGEIAAPTLILTGREDFFCPPAQAARMHRGIAGSEVVIFEHSGHYPFAEENPAFQDAVRTWVRRRAAS